MENISLDSVSQLFAYNSLECCYDIPGVTDLEGVGVWAEEMEEEGTSYANPNVKLSREGDQIIYMSRRDLVFVRE